MRLKSILFQALLLLLFWGSAAGQIAVRQQPDKWEFSFLGGWASLRGPSQVNVPVEDGGSSQVGIRQDAGYVLGVRISENLGRHFGAELEYTASDHTSTLANLQSGLAPLPIEQLIHNVSYNGVVYGKPRGSRIRPFGTAGVGASLFHISKNSGQLGVVNGLDLKDRWKLAFTFGGGVKMRLGRRWGVRFDVRDHVSGLPDYGLPRAAVLIDGVPTAAFRPDGLYHDVQSTVGISFWFKP